MPTPADSADPARALAFRTHVEPELEVLLRVARTLTGNPADAEDLVQETVIRAFRALERFDVDRLTHAEAADALSLPVGTVMSRLSRTLVNQEDQ